MARKDCPACDGTGFVVADAGAGSTARRCACGDEGPTNDMARCGLPRRYLHCTLDSYRPEPGNPSQRQALAVARQFVDSFPAVDRGILFTGTCGTGKTHLAAAMLRELVSTQGVRGVFADYQDLLKRIQATFSRQGEGATEEDVLAPVLEADLLVLDDLGSRRSTAWAEETLGHVLNVRYNEERTTIITTNLLEIDLDAAGASRRREDVPGDNVLLSERVPERVLSRIHEMCRTVRVEGPDHRRGRATRRQPAGTAERAGGRDVPRG